MDRNLKRNDPDRVLAFLEKLQPHAGKALGVSLGLAPVALLAAIVLPFFFSEITYALVTVLLASASLLLGTVSVWGQAPSLLRLREFFSRTGNVLIGWEAYIRRSAELYTRAKKIWSVVTEWEIDDRLRDALLKNDLLEEVVFVGPVEMEKHLPGVLWRLKLVENLRQKNQACECKVLALSKKLRVKFLVIDQNVIIPLKPLGRNDQFIATLYGEESHLYLHFGKVFSNDYKNVGLPDAAEKLQSLVLKAQAAEEGGKLINTRAVRNRLIGDAPEEDIIELYGKDAEEQFEKNLTWFIQTYILTNAAAAEVPEEETEDADGK